MARRHWGRVGFVALFVLLTFIPSVDGLWNLLRKKSQRKRLGDLKVPEELYSGLAKRNSWCAKASEAAKHQCHLLTETDRMQLSVLIANCHLEAIKRPHIYFDKQIGLRDESQDNIMLIFQVLGQVESICLKSGNPWPYAAVQEQGNRFASIQEKLEELQRAATSVSYSTDATLKSVSDAQNIAKTVTAVQEQVIAQTQGMNEISDRLHAEVEALHGASKTASKVQLENEKRLMESAERLTKVLANIPDAASMFEQSRRAFEDLLTKQNSVHTSKQSFATSISFGLFALVVSVGFLASKRATHLTVGIFLTFVSKKICGNIAAGNIAVPPSLRIASRVPQILFTLVPDQVLYLGFAIGILWLQIPSSTQDALLGDRLQITTYANMLAEEQQKGKRLREKLDENDEELQALKKKAKKMSVLIEGKQEIIARAEATQLGHSAAQVEVENQLGRVSVELKRAKADLAEKENELDGKDFLISELKDDLKKSKAEVRTIKSSMNALKAGDSILKARVSEAHSKILKFEERETQAKLKVKELEMRISRAEKQDSAEGVRQKPLKRTKSFRGPHGRVGGQEDDVKENKIEYESIGKNEGDHAEVDNMAEHSPTGSESAEGPGSGGSGENSRISGEVGMLPGGNHLKNLRQSLRPRRQIAASGGPQPQVEKESTPDDGSVRARLRSATPRDKKSSK